MRKNGHHFRFVVCVCWLRMHKNIHTPHRDNISVSTSSTKIMKSTNENLVKSFASEWIDKNDEH